MIKKFFVASLMALSIINVTNAFAASEKLVFGIISTEASMNLRKMWTPIIEDMSKSTGMEVEAYFVPDYAGVIEGMRFDKVDIAWVGNKSAIEAVDRAGAEVFGQSIAADGSDGYYSHIIAHVDSPINNLEDMFREAKKLRFGNGDPNSTSGFLVPSYYVFAKNNKDSKKIFKRTVAANHETNLLAVANKQVDVATNNNEQLVRTRKNLPDKVSKVKVIWTSPLIPTDPLVWRKELPETTKKAVADFFYNYHNTAEGKKALNGFDWSQVRPSTNAQLIPIRQLELFREKTKLEADNSISASERKTKLEEINKALNELNQAVASVKK